MGGHPRQTFKQFFLVALGPLQARRYGGGANEENLLQAEQVIQLLWLIQAETERVGALLGAGSVKIPLCVFPMRNGRITMGSGALQTNTGAHWLIGSGSHGVAACSRSVAAYGSFWICVPSARSAHPYITGGMIPFLQPL